MRRLARGIIFAPARSVAFQHGPRIVLRRVATVVVFTSTLLVATIAAADSITWPQPDGLGAPVFLTYGFSNLFDEPYLAPLTPADIRAATEEALGLWSAFAPIHFYERADSGLPPMDEQYGPEGHPDIRIGAHVIDDGAVLAHAFLPGYADQSGLAGDIHLNALTSGSWSLGGGFPTPDLLEVLTHEIGHALGLGHMYGDAIMGPYHSYRFSGPGTGYLLRPDIRGVQAFYGAGRGSVNPIPEPQTLVLVTCGVAGLLLRQGRRPRRVPGSAGSLPP